MKIQKINAYRTLSTGPGTQKMKVNGADLLLVKMCHHKKVSCMRLPSYSKSRVHC